MSISSNIVALLSGESLVRPTSVEGVRSMKWLDLMEGLNIRPTEAEKQAWRQDIQDVEKNIPSKIEMVLSSSLTAVGRKFRDLFAPLERKELSKGVLLEQIPFVPYIPSNSGAKDRAESYVTYLRVLSDSIKYVDAFEHMFQDVNPLYKWRKQAVLNGCLLYRKLVEAGKIRLGQKLLLNEDFSRTELLALMGRHKNGDPMSVKDQISSIKDMVRKYDSASKGVQLFDTNPENSQDLSLLVKPFGKQQEQKPVKAKKSVLEQVIAFVAPLKKVVSDLTRDTRQFVQGTRNKVEKTKSAIEQRIQHMKDAVAQRMKRIKDWMIAPFKAKKPSTEPKKVKKVKKHSSKHNEKGKKDTKKKDKSVKADAKPSVWKRLQNWLNPFGDSAALPQKKLSKEELEKALSEKPSKWQKFVNWISPYKVTPMHKTPNADANPDKLTIGDKLFNAISPFKVHNASAKTLKKKDDKKATQIEDKKTAAKTEEKPAAKTEEKPVAKAEKKPVVAQPAPVVPPSIPPQKKQEEMVERVESDITVSKDGTHLLQTVYFPKKNIIAIYDTDYSKGVNTRRGLDYMTVVDLNKKVKVTKRKLGGVLNYDAGVKETLSPYELNYYAESMREAQKQAAQHKIVRALSMKDIFVPDATEIVRVAPVATPAHQTVRQEEARPVVLAPAPVAKPVEKTLDEKREAILANKGSFVANDWTTEKVPDLSKLGDPRKVIAILDPIVDALRHKDSLTDLEMGEMSMMCRIINGYGSGSRTFSYLNRLVSDKFQADVARSMAARLEKEGLTIPTWTRSVKNNYDSRAESARLRLNLICNNKQNRAMLEELHRMGSSKADPSLSTGWLAQKYMAEKNTRNRW